MFSLPKFYSLLPRYWWLVLPLSFLALVLAHQMALVYRIQPLISMWFPPSGVAIAITLWFGPIGIVLTGLTSFLMAPFWELHGWERLASLTDAIEPLVAYLLYRHVWRGSIFLKRLNDAAAFTLSVPFLACGASATLGVSILGAIGKISTADLSAAIQNWWLGNAIGAMTITPIALLAFTPYLQQYNFLSKSLQDHDELAENAEQGFSRYIWVEISLLLLLTTGISTLTVLQTTNTGFAFQQFSFLSFIPILWAAVRFGVRGSTLIASFCVFVTLLAYLIVYPQAVMLANFPIRPEILHVHKLSLLLQCGVSLLIGTAITEKSATQVALYIERIRNKEYETQAQLANQLMHLNESLRLANMRLQETNRDKDELLEREQKARQALWQSETKFRRLVESNLIGVMFWDVDGSIVDANDAFLEMIGYTHEDLLAGQLNWRAMTPPEQLYLSDRSITLMKETGAAIPIEKEYICKDGSKVPIILGGVMLADSKSLGVSFVLNLTERKRMEEDLRESLHREQEARAEAENANRIKDEFLAVLSHELRTPLNSILGWSRLLRTRKFDTETTERALETIERNANLQTQLIEDLLDVSRILRGKLSLNIVPVNLLFVIESSLETMQLAGSAKSIQIQFLSVTTPVQVLGDSSRLQQVIWNLLANAIKFTPVGGKVTVHLSIISAELLADQKSSLSNNISPQVAGSNHVPSLGMNTSSTLKDSEPSSYAQISVIDTGKGISSEFLPYVFDYFRQADSSTTRTFGGLGLGLAIVRNLVELHGGTISAASDGEGKGATFTVNLPLLVSNN